MICLIHCIIQNSQVIHHKITQIKKGKNVTVCQILLDVFLFKDSNIFIIFSSRDVKAFLLNKTVGCQTRTNSLDHDEPANLRPGSGIAFVLCEYTCFV